MRLWRKMKKKQSNTKIDDLVSKYQDTQDKILLEKITNIMYNKIVIIAKKNYRYNRIFDYEDLITAGYEGLLDAIQKYDRKRNIQFYTYAYCRINGEIKDYIRVLLQSRKKNKIECTSIDSSTTLNENITYHEIISDNRYTPEKEYIRHEQKNLFQETKTYLGDIDYKVLVLYYVYNLTLKEISEIYSVTESSICKRNTRIKKELEKVNLIKNYWFHACCLQV